MTIIRTPRRWPAYDVRRRIKFAGIAHRPRHGSGGCTGERDFSTIIATAKMAVEARNQPSHDVTIDQTVLDGRDPVSVDGVCPEGGWASVFGFVGWRHIQYADLQVRVHVRGRWSE